MSGPERLAKNITAPQKSACQWWCMIDAGARPGSRDRKPGGLSYAACPTPGMGQQVAQEGMVDSGAIAVRAR